MAYQKPSAKSGLIPIIVTLGLAAGILIALLIAGTRELTTTESVLLGILLSAASMIVSWLVTHLYSQTSLRDTIRQATDSNTENIRSMGVRAAEKVLNLSSELQRLVDALATAMEDAENTEDTKQSTMLLRERVLSAIHNLETLKSMNDTFLSDWRGGIGEEIERQHILEKQIESLRTELYRQIRERDLLSSDVISPDDLAAVESRIEETEKRLTEKIVALPFKVHPKAAKSKKDDITIACASCEAQIQVRLRPRKGSRKLVKCPTCTMYSKVTVIDDSEMDIVPVPMYEFTGLCPLCSSNICEQVPNYAGAMVSITCNSCDVQLLLSKSSSDANLRIPKGSRRQMPQKLVDTVFDKLPQRPWPTHIHKTIATEMGVSNSVVSRIIGHLIEQGNFPPESKPESVETPTAPNANGTEPSVGPDGE